MGVADYVSETDADSDAVTGAGYSAEYVKVCDVGAA